jgi:hypothetical protein
VSEPWTRALEVMDQLIWSVRPKETVEERRKLATTVPVLLKSISAGLQAAGIDDQVREQFFTALMHYHTDILSAPPKGTAAPMPEAPRAPPPTLDFTSSITIKNPFGEGQVQVNALDVDPEETAVRTMRHGTDPDALRQGDWFEWKEAEGEVRPVRLIFMTPRKTRYIFRDRSEKDYIECTRSEIVRRLRSGEAVLMEDEPEVPFFERIMGGVVSKMKEIAAPA